MSPCLCLPVAFDRALFTFGLHWSLYDISEYIMANCNRGIRDLGTITFWARYCIRNRSYSRFNRLDNKQQQK
jgi:hypothetical protein